jgi:hypothetical protein
MDDEQGFFFIQLNLITGTHIGEGGVKPFVE